MAWWDDAGNFAASVGSAIGDGVEVLVEVVTETAESGVDALEEVVENVETGARDWVATNTPPVVGFLANVGLGMVKGLTDFGFDAAKDGLHIVQEAGHFVADIFRLDFAKALADLGNLGMAVLELGADMIRSGTGGYVVGAIVENFQRDRAMKFIRDLVIDKFGEERAETILQRLSYGSVKFGLRMPVDYWVMRMDSAIYPLAADHNANEFDLFALAGVLSFKSFDILRERTRVVMVDSDGNDQWYLPVGRSVIQSFLDTGSPRLRVYAWKNYPASRAMRFAHQKFRNLCILLNFDGLDYFSRFKAADVIDIDKTEEYFLSTEYSEQPRFELGQFLATNTTQNGELLDDNRAATVGAFKFSPLINGITAGVDIKRKETGPCLAHNTTDACVTQILRIKQDYFPDPTKDGATPTGRGVFLRDTYPPYFSKIVLAHELGHHFGLAHPGHGGFQNIMFTIADQNVLDWGLLKLYYLGEPDFQPEDLEDVWRFVVKEMPHVL